MKNTALKLEQDDMWVSFKSAISIYFAATSPSQLLYGVVVEKYSAFCGALFDDEIQGDNRWVIVSPVPFHAQLNKVEVVIRREEMTL